VIEGILSISEFPAAWAGVDVWAESRCHMVIYGRKIALLSPLATCEIAVASKAKAA
jgi:hypothetical protein